MELEWARALGKDSRGSRPRCILLADGSRESVAVSLTDLIDLPNVAVSPTDFWMPVGKPVKRGGRWDLSPAAEARLDREEGFLPSATREQLKNWWLAVAGRANTPNWDLASTCRIDGRPGLLLVEAKAHGNELSASGKRLPTTANGWRNHDRIGSAIAEANSAFRRATGGVWSLSRDDRYQLSNRFAWAWKIVSLGVPVVLLYLGFLKAEDMRRDGPLFRDQGDWVGALREHASGAIDGTCWNRPLYFEDVPLRALIRVR